MHNNIAHDKKNQRVIHKRPIIIITKKMRYYYYTIKSERNLELIVIVTIIHNSATGPFPCVLLLIVAKHR